MQEELRFVEELQGEEVQAGGDYGEYEEGGGYNPDVQLDEAGLYGDEELGGFEEQEEPATQVCFCVCVSLCCMCVWSVYACMCVRVVADLNLLGVCMLACAYAL
jgi:hypothetical protein